MAEKAKKTQAQRTQKVFDRALTNLEKVGDEGSLLGAKNKEVILKTLSAAFERLTTKFSGKAVPKTGTVLADE